MKQEEYKWHERIWKPIVRPPRHQYNIRDLGKELFQMKDTIVKRTDFELSNFRNQTLCCSLFQPFKLIDKPHPCMIYLHGNSSSRIESFSIIEYLIPNNFSVCGIDLSGSGLSEGEYISLGYFESQDVECLYQYLRGNKTNITQIGLWGRSMGAATAILAAKNNPNFKILVCDSPFSNLTNLCQEVAYSSYNIPGCCFNCFWCYVKSKIRKEVNFNIDELNIVQIIQLLENDVSIAFLSAKQDDLIKEKHPRLLMEKFRGNKIFVQFEGTHNSKRSEEVMKQTVEFIMSKIGQNAWISQTIETKYYKNKKNSEQIPMLKGDRKSVQPFQ